MLSRFACLLLAASFALALGHPGQGETPPARTKTPREEKKPAHVDRYGDPLPPGALTRLGTLRWRGTDDLYCLAFAPDGKTLITGDSGGRLLLWDLKNGKIIRIVGNHRGPVHLVRFSADGKTVASAGEATVRVWHVRTGKQVWQAKAADDPRRCLAFSPDGKTLAGKGYKDTINLWSTSTGKLRHQLMSHRTPVYSVAFSPDGKTLASGGTTIRFWDIAAAKEITPNRKKPLKGHLVVYSPDGRLLITAHKGEICVRQATSLKPIRRWKAHREWPVQSLTLSPDGKVLFSGGLDFDAIGRLWEVATSKELRKFTEKHRWTGSTTFSPDGKWMAFAEGPCIRLWETATAKEREILPGHRRWINSIAFSPDGKALATAAEDGMVYLWKAATGKPLHALLAHKGEASCVAFSPDGKVLASAGGKDAIRFWDPATGKPLRRTVALKDRVVAIAFSPNGQTLASSILDGTVRLWKVSTAKELWRFPEPEYILGSNAIAFSPDGKILACEAVFGVRLLEVATGKELCTIEGTGGGRCIAFSPNGKFLVLGGSRLVVLDLASGKELYQIRWREDINSLSFSPDGRTLTLGRKTDDSIALWELAAGQERKRFESGASMVAFSPDGRTLATAGCGTTALVWDVTGQRKGDQLLTRRLSQKELATLWSDLAGDDAPRAYRAIWMLVTVPRQAVVLLEKHLRAVPLAAVNRRAQARLIADLSNEDEAVREKALEALDKLAELAEPLLRKTLAVKCPEEVRDRLEKLLNKVYRPIQVPHKLRALRAIEILEAIDTTRARQVLKGLAQGAPAARLTQEAKAALKRLAGRPARVP
jgi:WD40 repeat protein